MRDRSSFRCVANLPCGEYSNPLRHFSKRLSGIYARIFESACPVYPLCGEYSNPLRHFSKRLSDIYARIFGSACPVYPLCGESTTWRIFWQPVNRRSHEAEPNSIIYPRSDEVNRGITSYPILLSSRTRLLTPGHTNPKRSEPKPLN